MVLTEAQVTAFFEGASQMTIPDITRIQLQSEVMEDPGDLVDFTEEAMPMISQNLRRLRGVQDILDPNATPRATTPTPYFIIGTKSQILLIAACILMKYYESVGRSTSVSKIMWSPVIRNF